MDSAATFEQVGDPRWHDGVLMSNLGPAWPVECAVAKFGAAPSLRENGHDWFFRDGAGAVYSLSVRRGVFVTGAPRPTPRRAVHAFEAWLRAELKEAGREREAD